jgi:hypothetical protein
VESHQRVAEVMHIVSSVEGKLSASKTPYNLMRATFPAGTVSGAPKIRARQIIADLESCGAGGEFWDGINAPRVISLRSGIPVCNPAAMRLYFRHATSNEAKGRRHHLVGSHGQA